MGFLDSMMGGMDTYGTSPSDEEKKRAFQYAVRGFGQGLLKGAFSNQPGAIGMGLSEGLNSFGDGWRGSLEADEKKRIDRQKTQNALELDKLQLEGARQNISEGQEKARDRAGRTQGIKAWSSAMADNVQEAEEYLDNQKNPDPEFAKYWKGRFKSAASMAERAIQVVDGKEVTVPEFATDAMKVFDEYEKATGDLALRQTILERTDEASARALGHVDANGVGDINWFRSHAAKREDEKDRLGIIQQQKNIQATDASINQRNTPDTPDPKLPLTQSQLNSLIGEAEADLSALFQIVKVPGEEDKVNKLAAKWGIANPDSFWKSWQNKDQRESIIGAIAINRGMKVKKAQDALMAQMNGGGQAVPNPSSEIKVLEPLTVINEARKATGDDRTREELKKKYPGLTDQQIKLQFGF